MKRIAIFFVFILGSCPIFSQINQGDVLINSFDNRWNGSTGDEWVVLMNTTNTSVDLNGYEVQGFGTAGESDLRTVYKFNSSYVMQPYTFLLLSTFYVGSIGQPLNGTLPDLQMTFTTEWPYEGYIALRKQNPTDPLDYLDIVKHARSGSTNFGGIPLNSGLSLSEQYLTVANTSLATRGGVIGDINSYTYTGFGEYLNDFTSLTENSSFEIQNSFSSPLPVELSSFSAIILKNGIKLKWRTETEVNNYGFEVERASSSTTPVQVWEKIGFVDGNGNSNSPKNYTYTDRNVASGKYAYRLKQIDNDGKYEYSKVIEVDLNRPSKFELSQNYPNPFNPTTTIRFSILETGNVKLTLFNILGQEIRTLVNEYKEAGVHTINFNAEDLNSGLYIYKLEANGLVQTRKMTLVK